MFAALAELEHEAIRHLTQSVRSRTGSYPTWRRPGPLLARAAEAAAYFSRGGPGGLSKKRAAKTNLTRHKSLKARGLGRRGCPTRLGSPSHITANTDSQNR
jgi:hypothetical protein